MDSYSLDYIDDLYVQFIRDPASVSPGWRKYFEEFSLAVRTGDEARPATSQATAVAGKMAPVRRPGRLRDEARGWRGCRIESTIWSVNTASAGT